MPQKLLTELEAYIALQQGDERGFDYIFNQYFSALCLYSTTITKQTEVSKEIVSDGFVKLWMVRDTINEYKKIRPLLYTIIRNGSLDFLRQRQREQKHLRQLHIVSAISEMPLLHNIAEAETYKRLYLLLESLPPRSRQIFRMFYFQKKAIKEISDELNISVNTVKTQKLRALQTLKSLSGSLSILVLYFLFFI